jgi:hypothetical protein
VFLLFLCGLLCCVWDVFCVFCFGLDTGFPSLGGLGGNLFLSWLLVIFGLERLKVEADLYNH